MTQLRQEGWIHHLARHAAACFLTRGDLWISWEEGMKVHFWFWVFSSCLVIFFSLLAGLEKALHTVSTAMVLWSGEGGGVLVVGLGSLSGLFQP